MWYPIAEDLLYKHLPVIVNAWYPGEQGGTAVAEVLFGDYNPAGRLPLTYYKFLEELPPFDDYDITKGRTFSILRKTCSIRLVTGLVIRLLNIVIWK